MDKYEMLELAIDLAKSKHKNQKDKAGKPYILHCLRVMHSCTSVDAKIVGVLHDIIEDTDTTIEELMSLGIPNYLLDALHRLTKTESTVNEEYLTRISHSRLATEVKLADLKDNLNLLRLESISKQDIKRINKYLSSYKFLENVYKGDI